MSKVSGNTVRAIAIVAGFLAVGRGAAQAGSASGSFQVSATVQARAILTVDSQPAELGVTAEDIRRGYVEVASASRIAVRSNSPNGYLVGFDVTGPIKQVEVTGLANPAQIGAAGGTIANPYTGTMTNTAELSYRFVLSADAQPGSYSWPVALSATPR